MKRLAIASMFRDSQSWHGRRIAQVERFFWELDHQTAGLGLAVEYHLVEGNSRDDTRAALEEYASAFPSKAVNLYRHEVAGSEVASVVSAERFRNLSAVGNTALRAARDGGADYVLWMESDLRPQAGMLAGLLEHQVRCPDVWSVATLAIAPVPVRAGEFYDTWGFEGYHGQRWRTQELAALRDHPGRYRAMRSVGSCALLNGPALREHALDFGTGCFPALCAAGRAKGLSVLCDVTLEVHHPSEARIADRWV